MKLRQSAAIAVSVLIAGSVHAQQTTEQPGSQPSFEFGRLDKNKDGFLSRQEAQADKRTAALFDRADTNKDGKLSEDELTRARAAQDREKAAEYSGDAAITTKVRSELLTKKGFPSTGVSISTEHGVVTLTGTVEQHAQIAEATRLVSGVGGVKSVNNRLTVKPKS
jgi:hyperosmotically inducible protein